MADFASMIRSIGQQAQAFPQFMEQRRQQLGRQLEQRLPQAPTPDMSTIERAVQSGKYAAAQPAYMASRFMQSETPETIMSPEISQLMLKAEKTPEERQRLSRALTASSGFLGMTAPQSVDMSDIIDDTAIAAINAGEEVPKKIGEDFAVKWKSTDAWRGHYTVTPKKGSGWEKIGSDWVTGNWSDAGSNSAAAQEARIQDLANRVSAMGGELKVILTPTSNAFSTGMDMFVRNIKGKIGSML
jgi:hypothetical protein